MSKDCGCKKPPKTAVATKCLATKTVAYKNNCGECGTTHSYSDPCCTDPSKQGSIPYIPNQCCDAPIKTGECCTPVPLTHTVGHIPIPGVPVEVESVSPAYAKNILGFTYPREGYATEVKILNIKLAVGQPLSNVKFGTLYVSRVINEECGLYELENRASDGSTDHLIGRPVPCGTCFFLGHPSQGSGVSEGPSNLCNRLLTDFFIPEIGNTSPAQVESFANFAVGFEVVIRNRANPSNATIYKLVSTVGTDILVLENEGDGGTPGQILESDANSDGEPDWCVEPLTQVGHCELATESPKILYVTGCDENGNLVKVRGTVDGQALVYDELQGCYVNQVVENATVCTTSQTCFQVNPTATYTKQEFEITTLDDATLLAAAQEALLTENADPLLEICGYSFSLDLDTSVEGALKVTALFNPTETIKFDENCLVCIPDDCCKQCAPQVEFPLEEYAPIGKTNIVPFNIPNVVIDNGSGTYYFSAARFPDNSDSIVFQHDPISGLVIAAFDPITGADVVLGTLPGDVNTDYFYDQSEYFKETPCPVEMVFEEDANMVAQGVQDNVQMHINHINTLERFDDPFALVNNAITQYQLQGHFINEAEDFDEILEAWGGINPTFRNAHAQSSFNKRSFRLGCGEVLRTTTRTLIAVQVTGGISDVGSIIGNVTTTMMLRAHRY